MDHESEILESAIVSFLAAAKRHPNGTQEVADRIAHVHYDAAVNGDKYAVLVEAQLRLGFMNMAGRAVREEDMSPEGQLKWQASRAHMRAMSGRLIND
jgi:hypothetical protein